jgi:DNA-binding GntR family transcriptional regulator
MKSKILPNFHVQPISVLDVAVQRLREAIMLGELLPGQRLVEGDLAQQMGISRPTLREALRRLDAQQLVVLIPNRGAHIATLGPEDVAEIRDVWKILTGEVVARFATRGSAEDFAKLKSMLSIVASAAQKGDALPLLAATNEFFTVILTGSGNRTFAEFICIMAGRINFLRSQSLSDRVHRREHVSQLRATVDHIIARQPKAARAAIEAHIEYACDGALKQSKRKLVA